MAKDKVTKLQTWQHRFRDAKNAYKEEQDLMVERDAYYNGDKTIYSPDGIRAERDASIARNVVFELVEAQVESIFPTPKVTPYRAQDEEKAKVIEDMLRAEMDRLPFERINDSDERTTPVQGGDFFLIEWDSSKHTHTTLGELVVQLIHPRKVIPQKGVESMAQSDWIFMELAQTKDYIKRRYGVDVDDSNEENPEIRGKDAQQSDDLVTQVIVFYKNRDGGIGKFSWVNDKVLEDLEDCQAPLQKMCDKCNKTFSANREECPLCGNKKLKEVAQEYIELQEDIVLYAEDGITERKRIPAYTMATDEFGQPVMENVLDEMGAPVYDIVGQGADGFPLMEARMQPKMEHTKIPVYKPDVFPLIMRKNVSLDGKFLGVSDVDFIRDMQNEMNKYMTKIADKTLSGGSVVIMPKDLHIKNDDEEMKIIEVENPEQASQIQIVNLQADYRTDFELVNAFYEWCRQVIGITDSFQGRQDTTATSGKAKEFSAAQAAGRFESKKVMKKAAYADVYELMFKYMLAYADEERSFKAVDQTGNDIFQNFCKWDYLEQDAAGEWYWNDRFLFSTDNTGNLANNREALWQETRSNFESGTFGNPMDIVTQIMYWTIMKQLHYPLAGTILSNLQEQKEQQDMMMQQQMAMQQLMPQPPIPQQPIM